MKSILHNAVVVFDDYTWRQFNWFYSSLTKIRLVFTYPFAVMARRHTPFNELTNRQRVALALFHGSEVYKQPPGEGQPIYRR